MSWDKLSMAERAKYIKLAVDNGVSNIDSIRDTYNSYAGGGYKGDENNPIQLPELVVTPRMGYTNYTGDETNPPTLEEYKQARRDGVRANALLDMQNTTAPTIPSVPNWFGRQFLRVFGDWYDDDDAKFIFGEDKNPNTCMSTVSSKYGRMVPGNITFRDNIDKLGFIEVPESERDHGDIIQTIGRRGVPGHAAMLSGFMRDGKILIDESHGGIIPGTIEHDINYFDTRPSLKNKKYYRFVGNEEDNRQWEKEYNSKYFTNRNKYATGGTISKYGLTYKPEIKGWINKNGKVVGGGFRANLSSGRKVHFNTDGTVTDFNSPSLIDIRQRLKKTENSKDNKNGGWDSSRKIWLPHASVEGGVETIAYGLKLQKNSGNPVKDKWVNRVENKGYLTDEEAEDMLLDLSLSYFNEAKKTYNKKTSNKKAWDKLSPKSQSILTDFQYNPGLTSFPNLMEAFNKEDINGIQKEYKRYLTVGKGKNKRKEELDRNKYIKLDIDSLLNGTYPIKVN